MSIVASCTDRAVQETYGAEATIFSLTAGGGYSKEMELRGDGSAWVSKKESGTVGIDFSVGFNSASGSGGLGAEFQVTGAGSYTSNYRYDNWRNAESFYHDGDKAHAPDSRTYNVGIKADGGIDLGPASAELNVSLGGKYTIFDNHQYYGNLGSSYTGYLSANSKLGVELGMLGGSGSASGGISYSVIYDRNGNPVRFVVNGEGQAGGTGSFAPRRDH